MKVCTLDSIPGQRELAAYDLLSTFKTAHAGALLIRDLCDSFRIRTAHGEHICLVHDPLNVELGGLLRHFPKDFDKALFVKAMLKYLLLGLDFMHSEAGMIHTGIGNPHGNRLARVLMVLGADIKASNIHFSSDDVEPYRVFEEDEKTEPGARKV